MGVETLAAATQEAVETIEDVYEPYLLQDRVLAADPRGRVITRLGRGTPWLGAGGHRGPPRPPPVLAGHNRVINLPVNEGTEEFCCEEKGTVE